ncbi:hypothetical protein SAMN02745823_02797 [Sporobacter termitidis DSM 10068]|uniref:Uncharacterized protein n=1 Tax=Sporobacter termitidis DSM 10068 TaxID=1123282 RepID=A0A1M5YSH0_9FIRM|nr:hypothetical protein [Sporobacter termitidis]SHI14889.1 hypothetical protein SAMN02745823_02797 [Sporobacter termitidis DSM 10068]
MKQIFIEPVRSEETRLRITPAIKNYPGRVIYAANRDDKAYLEIGDNVKVIQFSKEGLDFSDTDRVFLKWSAKNYSDDKAIYDYLCHYKRDNNLLIVIDEAFSVLGYNSTQLLKSAYNWDADIIIVFQSQFWERKFTGYNDNDWAEDKVMKNWEAFLLGEDANLIHHFQSSIES